MSSTRRGATRKPSDFYATPPEAFEPLIPFLDKKAKHWEPACGDGRLLVLMTQCGITASGADLEQDPLGLGFGLVDFLKDSTPRETIVTNPPFSLAEEFCDQALQHAREVWMLLRLNFLGAKKRRVWWRHNEPNALFILSSRPDFTGGGGDSCEYAWFYWGRRWQGIRHL